MGVLAVGPKRRLTSGRGAGREVALEDKGQRNARKWALQTVAGLPRSLPVDGILGLRRGGGATGNFSV